MYTNNFTIGRGATHEPCRVNILERVEIQAVRTKHLCPF